MKNKTKIPFLELVKYLSFKIPLNNNLDFIKLSEFKNKESITELFCNLKSIEKYFKLKSINIVKLIYFNRNSINKLLYNTDRIIKLDEEEIEENISYYFYLTLLISEDKNTINYSYTIDYIKNLNKKRKNNNVYRTIFLSKVILDLIENYKGINKYNSNVIEIEKIENEIIEEIKKNISLIEQLNLNYNEKFIKSKNIDEIYAEIIKSLIFQKKFEDYEFSYNILTQLELKSIDITEKIFAHIKNFLDNKNNNCITNYLISKESDIFDVKKLNFYYILLNFILKNSVFVYEINFLLKTRAFLIKLINDKSDIFSSSDIKNMDESSKEKLVYILQYLLDSNYYIQKYINLKQDESNKCDIIKTEEKDDEEINNEESIKEENNNEKKSNEENNIEENGVEGSSDEKNIISPINNFLNRDSNEFSKISNSNSQYFEQSDENENENESNNEKSIAKREIITLSFNDNNSNIKLNSSSLLSKNSPREINKNSNIIPSKNLSNLRQIISSYTRSSNPNLNKKNNINIYPYQIFEFQRIIGSHKKREDKKSQNMNKRYTADFITQIYKGYISGGFNNIFNFYNKNYEKEIQINNMGDYAFSVSEIILRGKHLIILCYKNSLEFYLINDEIKKFFLKYDRILQRLEDKLNYSFYVDDKYLFVCFQNEVLVPKMDYFNEMQKNFATINIKSVKSGIKIDEPFVALKTWNIAKSTIKFYNYKINFILSSEVDEHSLILSSNGLAVLSKEESDIKISALLCACKKYTKSQKNGILLIFVEIFDINLYFEDYFYDTSTFEVYCFCQLFIIKEKSIIIQQTKKKATNYFLVGGFEKKKNKGVIKLYKIIYEKKKIEFIQDVIFENNTFKGFNMPISSIIQSSTNGNIIITCWDGNVFLFSCSYFDYFLKQDEDIREDISFQKYFKLK